MKTIAVILAAGKGTRFGKSQVNKTAIMFGNNSLIQLGIKNIYKFVDSVVVVIGYKKDTVINSIKSNKVIYVEQKKRLGTGHAFKIALEKISLFKELPKNVLVCNGDHLFMIEPKILNNLLNKHILENNEATVLTTHSNNPRNLDNGRIIRKNKRIFSIIEKRNFSNITRNIHELNTGTYVFKYSSIIDVLRKAKVVSGKELYITEILFKLKKISAYKVPLSSVGTGINTKKDLLSFINSNKSNHDK